MTRRIARIQNPMPNVWLRPTPAILASLTALALLTGCGAAEEADGAEQGPDEPPPAATTQSGLRDITSFAGTGSPRFTGDGGPASGAGFFAPQGVALDGQGNLYISTDHRVRRVDAVSGVISTVAGTGRNRSGGDGGPAVDATLAEPKGIALDSAGNLFIAGKGSGLVRKVDAETGIISTVAGGGVGNELKQIIGDGGLATEALIKAPDDVALDSEGSLYLAGGQRIRKVDARTGMITTIAGTGKRGVQGDGGPATEAGLAEPNSVAVHTNGDILIADTDNHRIRKVDGATGIMSTVAGVGRHVEHEGLFYIGLNRRPPVRAATGVGYSGDGGRADEAELTMPSGVALGPQGDIYLADGFVLVRKVDASTGIITTVAAGETETRTEGGKIKIHTGSVGQIMSIAINLEGEIFLADYKNNVVHKVSPKAAQ